MYKLDSLSLPDPALDILIKVKGAKRWRDGRIYEAADNRVYWEIWQKNSVRLQGIGPGDMWKLPFGDVVITVKEYIEEKEKRR